MSGREHADRAPHPAFLSLVTASSYERADRAAHPVFVVDGHHIEL